MIVAIAHTVKSFDLLFVLNRLVRIKMLPELLIMNGQKIMWLKVENVRITWTSHSEHYLRHPAWRSWNRGTLSFLPRTRIWTMLAPRRTFRTMTSIRRTNLRGKSFYRGTRPLRRIKVSTTGECWNDTVRPTWREACQTFCRHFLQIGNTDVFLEIKGSTIEISLLTHEMQWWRGRWKEGVNEHHSHVHSHVEATLAHLVSHMNHTHYHILKTISL